MLMSAVISILENFGSLLPARTVTVKPELSFLREKRNNDNLGEFLDLRDLSLQYILVWQYKMGAFWFAYTHMGLDIFLCIPWNKINWKNCLVHSNLPIYHAHCIVDSRMYSDWCNGGN